MDRKNLRHRRFCIPVAPASASRLNLAERFFAVAVIADLTIRGKDGLRAMVVAFAQMPYAEGKNDRVLARSIAATAMKQGAIRKRPDFGEKALA